MLSLINTKRQKNGIYRRKLYSAIVPGKLEEARESEEMLIFLETMDEDDQIILAMLAFGHSYQEIQEVLGPISIGNLRVKANRARIRLAESMEREHE